ncbi:Dimethyl-sulfide monooxygenase [Beijerinckiaceae bacterium RH AL1]|nr:LLM class flavin-dependent oxidoreductase [Beijerinckiaceae bacterium]VVB49380.1 Dimethyl-sulfide monooxygenase [Beijerinckiaceae bacterium RH CH11]VVB49460.1 Dimethyl-sulfide monooxygenase [Beijerinckiaceae bacterium RH AL8]VVC56873.1 Dimethyl-sulfide monooxygenase [Beijerinckiaceae bacterium RH AL1]
MTKEILFNAFVMNCATHQSPGLWRHPDDRSADYTSLQHWADLARLLERGKFDAMFIADVLGVYDVYGGSPDAALRSGVQVPVNDPMMLVSAMALVTEHLGFGVTANLSYEPPYVFARRLSTLDHLTAGRIGWNIVTGYLDSAARGVGADRQVAHDDRYDFADEFLEVVYKLWEASWDDDAAPRDRPCGVFADPAKVRRVVHRGRHYACDAIHLSEPSPQRTPVLYQAGSSSRGKAFAGRHAECVFVSGPSAKVIAPRVAGLRDAAEAAGRRRDALKIFSMMTIVLGSTETEAHAKLAALRELTSPEGGLVLMAGWTGVDFSAFGLDEEVRHVENDAGRTAMDNITRADPSRTWTVGEVGRHVALGGIGPIVCGTPAQVAGALEAWVAETDVDGFNLAYALMPGTFADIVEHLVPELQRRRRYKTHYAEGTLREKLFGAGPKLQAPHPAALLRGRA